MLYSAHKECCPHLGCSWLCCLLCRVLGTDATDTCSSIGFSITEHGRPIGPLAPPVQEPARVTDKRGPDDAANDWASNPAGVWLGCGQGWCKMHLPHPDVHMYNLHFVCFHVSFCIIAPRPHSLPVVRYPWLSSTLHRLHAA